jgi:hypothetical protein
MKRRSYRRLRAVCLAVIAVAVIGIIAGAVSGSPSPSNAASKTAPTPTATATPTIAAKGLVVRVAARHRHRRHRRHAVIPAPAATTPAVVAVTTPAGCYPLSDEGTCYEPGEYCRDDDEGMTGVAGDGESIICEYNDGLRWEPN